MHQMTDRLVSDWIGKRLRDRYEIYQELGKAIGRRTLLADDLQTQRLVVIKVLTFGNDFAWADLRLFEREGEVLKSLDHAGIPNYLDYFEIDSPQAKGYALVQNFVDGLSLQDYLKAGRTFSEVDVIDIGQQLLAILQYLHSQVPPVIHRDLKPSNILLTDRSAHSQGQLYLVDFGSVQAPFFNPTGTLTIVGTYGYMPPEQFGGRAEPASDLYSLGATLIYLVTGCHPADLPQQSLRIQFESKATHISPLLRQWLRWLTTPEISQRPTSAIEALKGLRTLQDTGSLSGLTGAQLNLGRLSLNQHEGALDIVVPPKISRSKEASFWLNLLTIVMASGLAIGFLETSVWVFRFVWSMLAIGVVGTIPLGELVPIVVSIAFTLIVFKRISADSHLYLNIDGHNLIIYREIRLLFRSRQVLFKAKREEIERLVWGENQNTLAIYGYPSLDSYCLNRQKLGLTMAEFKKLAQELSDGLGISLESGNSTKAKKS